MKREMTPTSRTSMNEGHFTLITFVSSYVNLGRIY